jgi:hypothetical protein
MSKFLFQDLERPSQRNSLLPPKGVGPAARLWNGSSRGALPHFNATPCANVGNVGGVQAAASALI